MIKSLCLRENTETNDFVNSNTETISKTIEEATVSVEVMKYLDYSSDEPHLHK